MTYYDQWQLEKYGDVLPGTDGEPPLENDEMNEPYLITLNENNEQRDTNKDRLYNGRKINE